MKTKKKAISKKRVRLPEGFTVNPNMRDHSNDPVVKRKVDEANEIIKKFPLPDFQQLNTTKNIKPNQTIAVKEATYIDGYRLLITFSDGKEQEVDFSKFILTNNNDALDKYKDLKNFKKFKIEMGNVVWGKNWDLIFPKHELYKGKISRWRKPIPQIKIIVEKTEAGFSAHASKYSVFTTGKTWEELMVNMLEALNFHFFNHNDKIITENDLKITMQGPEMKTGLKKP